MERYQVYLNPESVGIIDDVADALDISRSQVIRDALEAVAARYETILAVLRARASKKHSLLDMIGIAESKTGRVGVDHDEIYLRD